MVVTALTVIPQPEGEIPPNSAKKRGRGKRLTRIEYFKTLEEVETLLTGAYPTSVICRTVGDQFQISGRTVRKYIERIYKRWNDDEAKRPTHRRERQLARIEAMIRLTMTKRDFVSAAAYERLYARIARTADFSETPAPPPQPGQVVNINLTVSEATERRIAAIPYQERERLLEILHADQSG